MASSSRANPLLLALLVLCTAFIHASSARPSRRGPSPSVDFDIASYCPNLSNGTPQPRFTPKPPWVFPLPKNSSPKLTWSTSTSGNISLPSPSWNLTLKAIAFGRGIQNYTCNASTPTTAPVAIGAVATLFDATALLPLLPPSAGQELLNLLPAFLICFPLTVLLSSSLPKLGVHYFDAAGVPTFDLGTIGLLKATKLKNIAAPEGASKGPEDQGYGAVDWLALTAKAGCGSRGLGEVYRVETAGGKPPPTCEGQPRVIEVQYAAQYWFYG